MIVQENCSRMSAAQKPVVGDCLLTRATLSRDGERAE
jgi:hypothetical protein